jgi:hypothetical protein
MGYHPNTILNDFPNHICLTLGISNASIQFNIYLDTPSDKEDDSDNLSTDANVPHPLDLDPKKTPN